MISLEPVENVREKERRSRARQIRDMMGFVSPECSLPFLFTLLFLSPLSHRSLSSTTRSLALEFRLHRYSLPDIRARRCHRSCSFYACVMEERILLFHEENIGVKDMQRPMIDLGTIISLPKITKFSSRSNNKMGWPAIDERKAPS